MIKQCDCLTAVEEGRSSPQDILKRPSSSEGPDDEPEAFCGLWGMLRDEERQLYHRAGVAICGVGENLFDSSADPTAWSQELRAVVRFLVAHGLDAEEVLRTPTSLRATGMIPSLRIAGG